MRENVGRSVVCAVLQFNGSPRLGRVSLVFLEYLGRKGSCVTPAGGRDQNLKAQDISDANSTEEIQRGCAWKSGPSKEKAQILTEFFPFYCALPQLFFCS